VVAESEIEGGEPSDQIGCVRRFTLRDGNRIREQLLALSDRDHVSTYCILDTSVPLRRYVATLTYAVVVFQSAFDGLVLKYNPNAQDSAVQVTMGAVYDRTIPISAIVFLVPGGNSLLSVSAWESWPCPCTTGRSSVALPCIGIPRDVS
jgi:hypothetical protein